MVTLFGRTTNFSQTAHAERLRLLALFTLIALSFVACDGRETATTGSDPIAPPSEQRALGGTITALRSAVGNASAVAVSGPAGKRSAGAGEAIKAGETLEVATGVEATVALDDGTALMLREGCRLTLVGHDTNEPGLRLDHGELGVTRAYGARGELSLALGGSGASWALAHGRATLAWNDQQGGGVSVESGELRDVRGTARLGAGQAAGVDRTGAAQVARTPARRLPPPSSWIEPLMPEIPAAPLPDILRGIGTLTARVPGSGRRSESALDLVRHAVDVTIRDGVALTRVEEAFTNHSGRTVEATYRFLLPSRASITRLALDVNGRIEEGEVLEKKRAKRIFKQIVDDSVRPRDPALLEWQQGSTFSMKIFPIKAGETRRVFISYTEPMTAQDGHLRYVYPLGGGTASPRVGSFSFNAEIETPHGLSQVRTPLYPAQVQLQDRRATVAFAADQFTPRTDLVLEYDTREAPAELRVATQTTKNGQTYAMVLLRPPAEAAAPAGHGQRVVAVVDSSYGTSEELRALASATVVELVAALGPRDTFAVLACDSDCRSAAPGFVRPSADELRRAHDFLSTITPGGASNLLGALQHAFSLVRDGAPATVVYVGDGVPTAGEQDPGRLIKLLEQTKPPAVSLQTVGVGPDVDSIVLDTLAAALGGSSHQLSVGEPPAVAAYTVARRINSAGLRDVTVEWPQGIAEVYPNRLGFVPAGGELALTARLTGRRLDGDVVLRGIAADGRPVERRYPIAVQAGAPAPGFIGGLWAKGHIDALTLQGGRDKEIVDVSRRMRVASRLTSWIVLENQRMYDRFNVQRTAAEAWDGEATEFAEVESEEQEDARALADLDDELDSLNEQAATLGGRGSNGSGSGAGKDSGGAGAGYGRGAGGLAQPSAAPKAAAPAKSEDREREAEESSKKAKRSSASGATKSSGISDILSAGEPAADYDGVLGGEIATSGPSLDHYRAPCRTGPTYDVKIGAPVVPGPRAHQRAAELAAQVQVNPQSRKGHRLYVRQLARLGRIDEALSAADSWRNADPLSTEALTALADQIARHGNRDAALRTYGSVAELKPTSAKIQLRLARGYRDLGRYVAAAGHFRAAAAASSKPEDMLEYLHCLAAMGWIELLEIEARAAQQQRQYRKISKQIDALVAGARSGLLPEWPARGGGAELVVRLEVDNPGVDLDLALIDPAGRRISGIWSRGAKVKGLGTGAETLSLGWLLNGSYQALVARGGDRRAGPVSGRLVIRCRDKRRTIPFTLNGSEQTVAQVQYKKRKAKWGRCW